MLQPTDLKAIKTPYALQRLITNLERCVHRQGMQPKRKMYYNQALVVCRKNLKRVLDRANG